MNCSPPAQNASYRIVLSDQTLTTETFIYPNHSFLFIYYHRFILFAFLNQSHDELNRRGGTGTLTCAAQQFLNTWRASHCPRDCSGQGERRAKRCLIQTLINESVAVGKKFALDTWNQRMLWIHGISNCFRYMELVQSDNYIDTWSQQKLSTRGVSECSQYVELANALHTRNKQYAEPIVSHLYETMHQMRYSSNHFTRLQTKHHQNTVGGPTNVCLSFELIENIYFSQTRKKSLSEHEFVSISSCTYCTIQLRW